MVKNVGIIVLLLQGDSFHVVVITQTLLRFLSGDKMIKFCQTIKTHHHLPLCYGAIILLASRPKVFATFSSKLVSLGAIQAINKAWLSLFLLQPVSLFNIVFFAWKEKRLAWNMKLAGWKMT